MEQLCYLLARFSVSCAFLHRLHINDRGTLGVGKIKDGRSSFYSQRGLLLYIIICKTEMAENKMAGTDKHRTLHTFQPTGD